MSSKVKSQSSDNLALQKIAPMIHEIRGERIIVDGDLAAIYGVPTKALNQAVKRNHGRFPSDFMFRLTRTETNALQRSRSQFVTLKRGQNIKYLPNVFTEHGAVMAANVLNSDRAVEMSLFVVRAFVKLRETLATHKELAEKITDLERKVGTHGRAIVSILTTIRRMTEPASQNARVIGFRSKRETGTDYSPKRGIALKRVRKK